MAVFKGDVGTVITIDMQEDISNATVTEIEYKKPSGTCGTWTATIEGTDSIKYTTVSGDLDEAGDWELQPYIDLPGWEGRGTAVTLDVEATTC